MARKRKNKKRNPFAGVKGLRRWGAGAHKNKKKAKSKKACRGKVKDESR
jgi:hypothetical protein